MLTIQHPPLSLANTEMENFSNGQYYDKSQENSQYPEGFQSDPINLSAVTFPEYPHISAQVYPPYSTLAFSGVPYGYGYRYSDSYMAPPGISDSYMNPPRTTVHPSVGRFQPIDLHSQSGSQNGWDLQSSAFNFFPDGSVPSQYVQSRVGSHQYVAGTPQQSLGSNGNRSVAIARVPRGSVGNTSPDMVGKKDMDQNSWPRLLTWYLQEGITEGQADDLQFRKDMRDVIDRGKIGRVVSKYETNYTKIHYKLCGGEMKFDKNCRAVLIALSGSSEVDWLEEAPCSRCTTRTRMGDFRVNKKKRKRAPQEGEGSGDR